MGDKCTRDKLLVLLTEGSKLGQGLELSRLGPRVLGRVIEDLLGLLAILPAFVAVVNDLSHPT